jgi:membrane protein DedA with SNARE-associated domain
MQDFLSHFSYAGLVLVLLATGVGLPLPEDVPLLAAGYLCNEDIMRLEIAIPLALAAVIGSDCILYAFGRRYGRDLHSNWFTRRLVTPERLARAAEVYRRHGGKALFAARFMPGLRAPLFFAAGAFRIPFWKLLVFDGGAAVLSVPAIILLGWWFAEQIDVVRDQTRRVQILIGVLIVLGVVGIAVAIYFRQRISRKFE